MLVVLHPEARAELRSVALWYEQHGEGLGDDFVKEVDRILNQLQVQASVWARWPATRTTVPLIQRALLNRFPYAIAFEQVEGRVHVLAIAHVRRRPLYWLARST